MVAILPRPQWVNSQNVARSCEISSNCEWPHINIKERILHEIAYWQRNLKHYCVANFTWNRFFLVTQIRWRIHVAAPTKFKVIAKKLCPWHVSCVFVACGSFLTIKNPITEFCKTKLPSQLNYDGQIVMEMKWPPVLQWTMQHYSFW